MFVTINSTVGRDINVIYFDYSCGWYVFFGKFGSLSKSKPEMEIPPGKITFTTMLITSNTIP